jgi:hypothetical protein
LHKVYAFDPNFANAPDRNFLEGFRIHYQEIVDRSWEATDAKQKYQELEA